MRLVVQSGRAAASYSYWTTVAAAVPGAGYVPLLEAARIVGGGDGLEDGERSPGREGGLRLRCG